MVVSPICWMTSGRHLQLGEGGEREEAEGEVGGRGLCMLDRRKFTILGCLFSSFRNRCYAVGVVEPWYYTTPGKDCSTGGGGRPYSKSN